MNHYWGTNKCFFYISLIPKLLFHTSRFQSLLQHQCNSEQLKIQAAMWNVHMLDRTHVPRCPCRCCCCFLICRCLVCDVLNHIAFFQSFGCVYLKCLSSVSSWETCRQKSFDVKGFQSERSTMWIKGLQHERSTVKLLKRGNCSPKPACTPLHCIVEARHRKSSTRWNYSPKPACTFALLRCSSSSLTAPPLCNQRGGNP